MDQVPQRNYAMYCHLSFLAIFFGSALLSAILVLVLCLTKKNDSDFNDLGGPEAGNLQITHTILFVLLVVVSFLWMFVIAAAVSEAGEPPIGLFGLMGSMNVLILLFASVPILHVVFSVIAGIKAKVGLEYRYPLILRFR